MKYAQLEFAKGFRVCLGNDKAQGAVMVLAPGDCEGGPRNRHRGADQWLFVTEGTGTAIINEIMQPLNPGTLLLIEAGDTHEIRNTGKGALRTVNIYVPPAYTEDGEELPAGKA
jgi:mannose-6-phosphate isomerase-like protein (cupin superfamily)